MKGLKELFNNKLSVVALGGLAIFFVVVWALSPGAGAIDPRVTLKGESASDGRRPEPNIAARRLAATMDGEVSHTADRLAEATALAFSAGVRLADTGLRGRLPRDVQSLLADIARNGLLPPGLAAAESVGTFATAHGSLSVRYRPSPLGIEVISIGSKPGYGPALIVRLPDDTSDKGEAKLFVADRLRGVPVPAPFAPAAEVIALGWSPEELRSLK
jgi:hypothetical protein